MKRKSVLCKKKLIYEVKYLQTQKYYCTIEQYDILLNSKTEILATGHSKRDTKHIINKLLRTHTKL